MPEQDRIDSVIDVAAVTAELNTTKKSIKELVALIQSVKGTTVKIAGAANLAEYKALKAQLDLQIKTSNAAAKAAIDEAKAREINAKAALVEGKAINENTKSKVSAKKAANDQEKALKAEKKAIDDATNEYLQLSIAYREAALRAKNMQIALGANNPVAKAATAEALALGTQLKLLDASTGTFNRNVGNYGGALVEYGKKAFGFIRTAANILPGLGLSGAFLLIFKGFQELFKLIDGGVKAFDELGKSQKLLNAAFADGGYKDAVRDVKELTTYVQLAKEGFANKADVLAEYNKRLGDSIGKANSLDEAEQLLVKNGDAYIKVTLLKAAANIALNEAAALAVELAKEQSGKNIVEKKQDEEKLRRTIEQSDEYQRLNQKVKEGYAISITQGGAASRALQDFYDNQLTFLTGGVKARNKQTLEGIAEDFQKAAATLGNKFGIDIFGNKDPKAPKDKTSTEDLAERNRKAIYESTKAQIQAIIDATKAIAEDETKAYDTRLYALHTFLEAKQKLAALDRQFELDGEKKTKDEIKAIEIKSQVELENIVREGEAIFKKIRNDNRIELLEKTTAEEVKIYDKLYKDLGDRYKKFLEEKKKNEDKERKEREEKERLTQELIAGLSTLTFTLFTSALEKQKNLIQDQIDLLEERKQKDIEAANATIVNVQDRAAAVQLIEARAAAQKEQLIKKQRDLDIKKAQFDRLASIARVVQETAQNIVKFFPNPVLMALAGAIGAVQIATITAQPIPRYKGGVDSHPGGLMVVGDGGKSEGIQLPDGSIVKSPATDTLMMAPKGTRVHPDYDKMMMQASISQVPQFKARAVSDTSTPVIVAGLDRVEKAVKKIPQQNIVVDNIISKKIRGNKHLV